METSMMDEGRDNDTSLALDQIFPALSPGPSTRPSQGQIGSKRAGDLGYAAFEKEMEDDTARSGDKGAGQTSMPPPMAVKGKAPPRTRKPSEPGVKKTRSSQSCDACRARKTKCDRPLPGTPIPIGCSTAAICSHCSLLNLDCTFDFKPRKRGPPNMYIMKVKTDRASPQNPSEPFATFPSPSSSTSGLMVDSTMTPSYLRRDSYEPQPRLISSYSHPAAEGYYPPISPGGTLSSQNTYGGSALGMPGQGQSSTSGKSVTAVWDEALHRAVAASASSASHRSAYEEGLGFADQESPRYGDRLSTVVNTSSLPPGPHSQLGFSPSQLSPSFSLPQYALYSPNPSNPLDQVLPRGLLLLIVELFFDYIYPLIPAIHRPTFIRDLANHREEREGEEEWTHMVLILVAATLLQVPRAFVPMPRSEVKALVERCWSLTRAFTAKDWSYVSLERLTMNYLLSFCANNMGRHIVSFTLSGANSGTLLRLRLHQETTYATMPPLEREFRRRLFWLAYGGDRSISAIDGWTTFFGEDECDAELPREIDDEYITEDCYLEQPEDTVSLVCGFNYISKIFKILGQVMVRRRQDKRSPPVGIMLQMRITEVSDLYDQVMAMMDDCPEPLRLDLECDTRSVANFSEDWDAHASADIRSLFFDPKASRAVAKDAFLVQQANIYVTQQMVRYITLQYRDDLLQLRQAELTKSSSSREPGVGLRRKSSSSVRRDWSRAMFSDQEKDQVATDLLGVLQKIPIQVIAVNSAPLVAKVRFVASTLLDALTAPMPSTANPTLEDVRAETKTQKAQSYLWDFLRILSEIEALYSFEDDVPSGLGAGSGDGIL